MDYKDVTDGKQKEIVSSKLKANLNKMMMHEPEKCESVIVFDQQDHNESRQDRTRDGKRKSWTYWKLTGHTEDDYKDKKNKEVGDIL